MNLLLKLGTTFFGNTLDSLSQNTNDFIKAFLLSSFLNNVLGNITSLSFVALFGVLALKIFGTSVSNQTAIIVSSISMILFFSSLILVKYLTRSKKIEEITGLTRGQGLNFDMSNEVLSLVKYYLDENQNQNKDNSKVDKIEEALKATTEAIQELEFRVRMLDSEKQASQNDVLQGQFPYSKPQDTRLF